MHLRIIGLCICIPMQFYCIFAPDWSNGIDCIHQAGFTARLNIHIAIVLCDLRAVLLCTVPHLQREEHGII